MAKYFIAGGAGFIGSHLTTELLLNSKAEVVVYDNFTNGRAWHLEEHKDNPL